MVKAMVIPVYVFLLLFQLCLVLLFVIAFYYFRYRKISKNNIVTMSAGNENETGSTWLNYIVKQIEDTQKQQTEYAERNENNAYQTLEWRKKMLNVELAIAKTDTKDSRAYWEKIVSEFDEIVPSADENVSGEHSRLSFELVNVLKLRIKNFEERIKSLEKFKILFIKLKNDISKTQDLNIQLSDELEANVPKEKRTENVENLLIAAQQENEKLSNQISFVENEFDLLVKNISELSHSQFDAADANETTNANNKVSSALVNVSQNVGKIKNVVSEQEARIKELNHTIDKLSIEVKDLTRLKEITNDLSSKNREMSEVVEIFEEENEFLQQQIQTILEEENKRDKKQKISLRQLQNEIIESQSKYAELENSFAKMEKEYLAVYDELNQMK